ncbi:MaoC/PaaZ C-terminal domain-containing protein [Pseudonocardia phyllosphaerae]|uniref:MaoC/PaaZ C-terminal domain-containing protein n=1 Tax=Pseudonocardia phyllosphaerae TaxID=3390502 RepID=UPI003978CDDA
MTLAPNLAGTQCEPVNFAWERDDVLLYAVAVGAGADDPTTELALTTEDTGGVRTAVLPSFAEVITRKARVDLGSPDPASLVHAEQSVRLAAPLPVSGWARVTATVTDVVDLGSGALIRTEAHAADPETGAPLFSTVRSSFLKGAGGFGGERPEPRPDPVPDREPDVVVTERTAGNQALIYRLTGDRNPLCSDPAVAARGGYDRPILQGMCTFGFAARAVVAAVCDGDPSRIASLDARFTAPVYPGQTLTVSVWRTDDGAAFRVAVDDGAVVVDRGSATLFPVA